MAEIVTVDGGASSCRLAAFSSLGEELARVSTPNHASLSMGAVCAWQHIELGLASLQQQLKLPDSWRPSQLVMGLAGALQQQHRAEFLSHIRTDFEAILVTDGFAQLVGATTGKPGICLSVGTGSVVHWLDEQGQSGMGGGWGFPVGDQGSGAWLGMRALQHYIRSRDTRFVNSSLIQALEQQIGVDISDIQRWTTETRSSTLARLAPLVFEHASTGDDIASALVDEALSHCLQLVHLAPANLPVFVAGGIGEQLRERLAIALPGRIRRADHDALFGLWLISKGEL